MINLGVKEEDLVETFVRSSGSGGQKVNKTSTCVYLKHIPTGTEVKCHKSRSQPLNRYYARVMILDKIDNLINKENSKESIRVAKIKKQKQKRYKRTQKKLNQME